MRWVLRSEWLHHIDIVRQDCGIPFIIGATMFHRVRPRSLENYIKSRKGYEIEVRIEDVDPALIVKELDKPYDIPAALSLIHLRIFGNWNGHTGKYSEGKDYCLELIARILKLDQPWRVLGNYFEKK